LVDEKGPFSRSDFELERVVVTEEDAAVNGLGEILP
jgi:hypothetical protein